MKFFYNNLGIRALIIYFCFVLIDLINQYKNHTNIYSRNTVWGLCDEFYLHCYF